jgi:hypothetical protein
MDMSIKRNLLTGAATLTIAAGVFTVGTPSASAATPACGADCISIFSRELGTYGQPNVVEAVLDGVARVGQPVILAPASSSDPSQDFLLRTTGDGRVSDFYAAGMVSAELNRHYGTLMAAQIEYAPFGDRSGLCVGLATTAFQGQGLTLRRCTVPATTVWIPDPAILPTPPPAGYFPIVNGSTTDFSRPFAMHYPRDQQATDQRLQQIKVRRLQYLSDDHTVPDRQLWGAHFGVLP